MDPQTLLYVMTAFVIVAAVALVLQFAMLFGIYRTAKSTEAKMTELLPKAHSFLDTSQKVIAQSQQQIAEVTTRTNELLHVSKQQILEISSKTNDILDSTKRQVNKVEDLLNDATSRARVQIEKAEMVLDDTVSRAHETVAMVHSGILRPLREIQGVAAGVRSAIGHLARGTRPSVAQATHDEEMFI